MNIRIQMNDAQAFVSQLLIHCNAIRLEKSNIIVRLALK